MNFRRKFAVAVGVSLLVSLVASLVMDITIGRDAYLPLVTVLVSAPLIRWLWRA